MVLEILNFLKNYWTILTFMAGVLGGLIVFSNAMIEGMKCTLRNDILAIWDRCKDEKKITLYQLQAVEYSYKIYKRLKGNSFVQDIVEKMKTFEIID